MPMKLLQNIFCILCTVHGIQAFGGLSKTWTYYFISIETKSSSPDLLNLDLKVDRIGRGEFAISGKVMLNSDVQANTQIAVKSFRSASGSSEYTPLPFGAARQHVYEFLNTFYKSMAMKTLANCSNLWQFEGKFVPPVERKTYVLNKCSLSMEALPLHMQAGYYKIRLIGYGHVEWLIEVLLKVEKKIT